MTSRYRVFGLRFALGAALLASACQQDSNAEFDDRNLTSPDVGGSADSGGSNAAAGEENPSAGGTDTSGGSAPEGGKSSAGAAGSSSATAGKGGTASVGGKGGSGAGGTPGQAGKAGQGGAAGSTSGSAGMAGSTNPPEPITVETADIDDTHVASCFQQQNFGEAEVVMVDGSSCRYDALIDVPRLELPAGALVSKATLTLTCSNAGAAITVAYADEAWKELTVRWSTRPEVGATIGTITCAEVGTATLDLTAAFKAWLAGDHAANGIYLRTEGTNGTDFASSEADKVSSRPQLSITYTLPIK